MTGSGKTTFALRYLLNVPAACRFVFELVTATQLPHKVNGSITGQATELVCFRLDERLALDTVEDLGADRAAVQALPLGSFVSWNRISRVRQDGRIF